LRRHVAHQQQPCEKRDKYEWKTSRPAGLHQFS
jgi:hypothetical protein